MNTIPSIPRATQNAVCALLAVFTVTVFLSLGTMGIEAMAPDTYGVITISEA
jgi:hypothetical protein